ncbi:hypothetical protein [Catellatospora vulcania]|uniref:hypothetical protein n=1 Tax=Catellatospora vulcania TaxID=1460450 RepID=UPI0012D3D4C5|nr:hypothetical protein [Catellatospora vulcania]
MPDEDFTTRGGVAYIAPRMTWPFYMKNRHATSPLAELRVSAGEIAISSPFGKFLVTRANLVSISRFGRIPVLADGFKFETSDSHEALVFWAMGATPVRDALQRRGWEVVG